MLTSFTHDVRIIKQYYVASLFMYDMNDLSGFDAPFCDDDDDDEVVAPLNRSLRLIGS